VPTGQAHDRAVNTIVKGELVQEVFPCRCMEGEDHIEGPTEVDSADADDSGFSFSGAEEIYDSSGRDEDYDFR